MSSIAFTRFLATCIDHFERYTFDARQLVDEEQLRIILVPYLQGTAFAQVQCTLVYLTLLGTIQAVHDGTAFGSRRKGSHALHIASDDNRCFTSSSHLHYLIQRSSSGNRTNHETEVAGCLGSIRNQRSTLTTAVTTQTGYLCIEMQIYLLAFRKLVRMSGFGNVHFTPWKCRCRHYAIGYESSATACSSSQSSPTYFFVVTHRLRLAQYDFIAHLLTEDFNVLTHLTVVEVICRTTAIVSKVYIFLRQYHGITQASQVCCRLVGRNRALEFYRTIGINGPYLIGSELEVIFTERFCLVVHNGICIFRITVAVSVLVLCTIRSLTFYGKRKHHTAILGICHAPIGYLMLQVMQAVLVPLVVCPVVVTYRSTEAIELWTIAIGNHDLSAIYQAIDSTGLGIELHGKVLAIYYHLIAFGYRLQSLTCSNGCNRRNTFGRLHSQLLFHLYIALLSPWHIGTQEELYLHEIFALSIEFGKVIRQSHHLLATRCYRHARTLYRCILLHTNTILPKRPNNLIIVQWYKVVFIEDFDLALLCIQHLYIYILVYLLHFVILRLACEVRHNDTIHTESTIVRLVTEVTTITEETVACLLVVVIKTMVYPFPDSTTNEEVGSFHRIPIVHQVTTSITHRVRILRNVIRILDVILTCNRTLYPSDRRILVGTYIDNIVITFILYRTALVECLDCIVSSHEVVARTGFVTQTPQTYRRMVDACMYHFHVTGYVCILPFCRMRSTFLTIIVLVTFDIRFVFQIDTVLIAQVIPIWSTWIVRVTHMVDVGTLHHHHFFGHAFVSDVVTAFRIGFVTVYPFHLDRLAIQVIITACQSEFILVGWSILDFDFAETYVGRECFYDTTLLILQLSHQSIAIRLFSTPRLYFIACIHGRNDMPCITRKNLYSWYIYSNIVYQSILIGIQLVFIQ